LAYISTFLVLIAPLLVTLALKVNALVGIEQAPNSLAFVPSPRVSTFTHSLVLPLEYLSQE
jgi:hypothetical protein